MNERTIEGFPGYTITSEGVLTRRGKVVGRTDDKGYIVANLRNKGKRRTCKVHTLVLEAFVGPRPDGHECRHLNGIPSDNRLENLCWGTSLENSQDKVSHGTMVKGEDQPGARLTAELVLKARERVRNGETSEDIAKEWGFPSPMIRSAVNGRKWKHLPGAIKSKPGPKKKLSCGSSGGKSAGLKNQRSVAR